jgi:hypothetical protein
MPRYTSICLIHTVLYSFDLKHDVKGTVKRQLIGGLKWYQTICYDVQLA